MRLPNHFTLPFLLKYNLRGRRRGAICRFLRFYPPLRLNIMKKCFKCALITISTLLILLAAYTALCYFLARAKTIPAPAITTPSAVQTAQNAYLPNDFLFLHQVNTPKRLVRKERKFNNFEIDLYPAQQSEQLYAAHDDEAIKSDILLEDLFSSLKTPARYNYWLDIKAPISQANIDYVKTVAAKYNINPQRLIFEPSDDATALLLRQNGFNILLFTPGFKENLPADKLAALIKKTEERINTLQPIAISGGISSYHMFKTYFPNYRKAIYYTTTKRPSLKKVFLIRFMKNDPQVAIFLTDEY